MSNMSYCRFENTNRDFADCCDVYDEIFSRDPGMEYTSKLSTEERRAAGTMLIRAINLVKLAAPELEINRPEILTNFDDSLAECDEILDDL